MSGTYEDLKVWQRAMELVADIYQSTRGFPKVREPLPHGCDLPCLLQLLPRASNLARYACDGSWPNRSRLECKRVDRAHGAEPIGRGLVGWRAPCFYVALNLEHFIRGFLDSSA